MPCLLTSAGILDAQWFIIMESDHADLRTDIALVHVVPHARDLAIAWFLIQRSGRPAKAPSGND